MESKAVAAQSPPSDNDGGERPVRQQLKETNLNAVDQSNGSSQMNRKRSLENTDGPADARPTKRSRECTPDDTTDSNNPSTDAKSTLANDPSQDVSDSELDSDPDFIAFPPEIEGDFIPFPPEIEEDFIPSPPEVEEPEEPKEPKEQETAVWPYPGVNGNDSHPEDRIIAFKMPLTLDIKIAFAGTEQIKHVTIPVKFEFNSRTGAIDLASSVSESAMNESSGVSVNLAAGTSPLPSLCSTSPLPSLCSDYPSPSVRGLDSPKHSNYRHPTVETLDSDSESPQNLESTTRGNKDASSQGPKKKRSREQLEADAPNNSHAATEPTPSLTEPTAPNEKSTAEGQPEKKRPRDNSEERKAKVDQSFTESAFGKASTGSPFALNTSESAASPFAMSSTKSAFGASPFATSGASATAGFGSLGGTGFSAFGGFSGPSGKLTSFASPNAPASFSGSTGKLTSFASPNAPTSFGDDSKDKTLGATKSDNEESDNEPDGEGDDTFVAEKTDERFHEQSIETGEENETTEFLAKAKLYYFDDKKWKERGAGTFKVNSKMNSDGKKAARLIMRADGAHRVMLNSAIWKSMPYGVKGQRPTTKDIYLASKEDNKVSTLLLRLGNDKQSSELYDVLKDLVDQI